MKKAVPYLILSVVMIGLIALFLTGREPKKQWDDRVTLRRGDKIPFGTWVAFESLPSQFPNAAVYTSRRKPGTWTSVSAAESGQLFISITPRFMADEYEMEKLLDFAERGNDVFVSTRVVSGSVERMLECGVENVISPSFLGEENQMTAGRGDSLGLVLLHPPFSRRTTYHYPGMSYDATFSRVLRRVTDEIGTNGAGRTNFIHLRAGKGNFYLHLAPIAFSNYFLLHKQNLAYYEKALSVISPDTRKILWDEYYLNRRESGQSEKKKSWVGVLFRYPGLKAALITALITLVMFLLLEMRRRQRHIPVITKPRNDSLDFVKTIGRLYYDKGDHRNLCRKMSGYFLEFVRNRYKLATGTLDDSFVRNLQFKSGVSMELVREIVNRINQWDSAPDISPAEVANFHKLLESFYDSA